MNKDKKEITSNELDEMKKFDAFSKWLSDDINQKPNVEKAIIDISERLSLNGENLEKILTELNDYEITKLSLLESINDTYVNSKLINGFISKLLIYRISNDRKGREDLKQLLKALNSTSDTPSNLSFFQRLRQKI